MKNTIRTTLLSGSFASLGLVGCAQPRPVTMAPPVAPPPPVAAAPVQAGANNVYDWHDVPAGQQVTITRAVFDQGGYQLYAASGETIVVPFANNNMYVMKFGRTGGDMYFINEGGTPTLYVREGAWLENASASGARWYPFPQNYAYTRPVYLGIAPSWSAYTSMGWYPGMHYYGGYWSYNPWSAGIAYAAMPGLVINVGGRPYYGWNSYSTYYRSNPVNRVMVSNSRGFNYGSVRRGGSGSFGSTRSTGSFGSNRTGSTGSFGSRPGSSGMSASRPTFGSGSFGGGSGGSRPGSFGGGSTGSRPGSFGSGSSGFGSSGARRTSSFGSTGSGFSSSRPSGGSSFGSSGRSFGGGGRSFGGGRRR